MKIHNTFARRAEKKKYIEKSRMKKISLKEYLDFYNFGKQIDITVSNLNQIIAMHGFRKFKVPKKNLVEAVQSLDLMKLSRSTLRDNRVSSCASMNLEDIIRDLNKLDWKDCCITSFQTINFSSDDNQSTADLCLVPNSHSVGQLDDEVETRRIVLKDRRKKKKTKSLTSIGSDFGSSS